MTLEEIKRAVEAGKTVHWFNDAYRVIRDSLGQWFICFEHGDGNRCGLCIGLTWLDGVTLNGKPDDFFVAE